MGEGKKAMNEGDWGGATSTFLGVFVGITTLFRGFAAYNLYCNKEKGLVCFMEAE